MALTNPDKVVTEERLNEYHQKILPYLGGNSMVACGGGYAPIGTVIAYMGTRAPSDFLICDGTVYNLADYTELADFFELQFGSSNFFGGDGNTTFAVPDLRGEFLRGTGTNSHANQGSGANVGVHQDGTEIPRIKETSAGIFGYYKSGVDNDYNNADSIVDYATNINNHSATAQGASSDIAVVTSRPTNTSVLYCIKAKSQGNGYSLDEQIVGTWIDGKPIYQKVVDCGTLIDTGTSEVEKNVAHGISNLDTMINSTGVWKSPSLGLSGSAPLALTSISLSIYALSDGTNILLTYKGAWSSFKVYAILQYTKTTDV